MWRKRAKRAGFDLVEIHAAHGYLISQFFSRLSNRRGDAYGGDLEGRTRFAAEIVRRVREAVGPQMAMSCRLNGADHVAGGPTLEDMKDVACVLVDAGLDMISISAGVYGSYPTIVPPYDMPKGCYVKYAEGMKGAVNVPVAVAGRITARPSANGPYAPITIGSSTLRPPSIAPSKVSCVRPRRNRYQSG